MRKILQFCLLAALPIILGWSATVQAQTYLNYSINQAPALNADAGIDVLICTGGNATLGGNPTANGGNGGFTYSWAPSASLNSANSANPNATPSTTTIYTLLVQDSLGCSARDTIEVVVDTCISIGSIAGVNNFDVFPNPNEGLFTVAADFESAVDNLHLNILDLSGRSVYSKNYALSSKNFREQIALPAIAKGTYFIRIEADGQLLTRKMILR